MTLNRRNQALFSWVWLAKTTRRLAATTVSLLIAASQSSDTAKRDNPVPGAFIRHRS